MKTHENVLISESQITASIAEAASLLQKKYAGASIHFVVILKGTLFFAADLMKALQMPCTFSTIECNSYVGKQQEELTISYCEDVDVSGRHVIILDDIFDTGITMHAVFSHFKAMNPRTLETMVFVKKIKQRKVEFDVDYALHTIEDEFVIGYGLDMHEYERNRKEIYTIT